MNAISLINRVKYNKTVYAIYSLLGSFVINFLRLFIKTDDKLIIFVSFGGRKYDDSPKAIYERMSGDSRFADYRLVWAFINPEQYSEIAAESKIKIDTLNYYINLLKARVWITNSGVERGLNFKAKNVLYFNTWHGTPIKVMGSDLAKDNQSFSTKIKENPIDIMLAQSQYDVDVFSRVFNIPVEKFRIIGLPRNDELVWGNTPENIAKIKKTLGIKGDKKVILYAPTFREYSRDCNHNCTLVPPIDLKKWQEMLEDKYVLLFRAHYEVVKVMSFEDNDFVKNVSNYHSLNDLMIVSDMLVSDYSSVYFDYSIQSKPMLTFCYDYSQYSTHRGMYFDIREALQDDNTTEDALIQTILDLDYQKRVEIAKEFREKYVTSYGEATSKSLDVIVNMISHKN